MKLIIIIAILSLFISCDSEDIVQDDIVQWGTTLNDTGKDAIIDKDNNLYVVSNQSESYKKGKLVITKFDSDKKLLWSKEFSQDDNIFPTKIKIDSNGDLNIIGYKLKIETIGEGDDIIEDDIYYAFISKFDSSGNLLFIKDIDINNDGEFYALKDFEIKGDELYIIGDIYPSLDSDNSDLFLIIVNNLGEITSKKTWGSDRDDVAIAISFDKTQSNFYVLGISQGSFNEDINFGAGDIMLSRFDNNDNNIWNRTWGTSKTDFATEVKIDENDNIYVLGHTSGMIEEGGLKGENDIFISKVNLGGYVEWSKQFGSSSDDFAKDLLLDKDNIYILGDTLGSFEKSFGDRDIFLLKLNSSGDKLSLEQFGTALEDSSFSLVKDDKNLFLLGNTLGSFKKSFGDMDLFKIKITK